MKLGIDFDADRDDVFHSHGYARVAYGQNLGSASSVPGGGRAGTGNIGAVESYRYADVSHRHKREHAGMKSDTAEKGIDRFHLHVKEREDKGNGAAFSHRDQSQVTVRTFREPPGRSYNPYS